MRRSSPFTSSLPSTLSLRTVLLATLMAGNVLTCFGCGEEQSAGSEATTGLTDDREAQLRSIGYVESVPIEKGTEGELGVTRHDEGRAYQGYNLFSFYGEAKAYLCDMDGNVVHTWASETGQPETRLERTLPFIRGWQYTVMLPTGELLAVVSRGFLLKLDWDSNVVWKKPIAVHHDVSVDAAGRIFALTEEFKYVGGRRRLILDSVLVVLTPEGVVEESVSVFDVLITDERLRTKLASYIELRYRPIGEQNLDASIRSSLAAGRAKPEAREFWTPDRLDSLEALSGSSAVAGYTFRELFTLARYIPQSPVDILHTNAFAPVLRHESGLWDEGDLLVSVRNLDLIGVIGRDRRRFRWIWGPGVLHRQHQPSMLSNQHILVFDNGQTRSRVLEVDPTSNQVRWRFDGGLEPFFTVSEGGVQRLPNGNTLIVVSRSGRVIEVTPDGEIVWEYWTPFREDIESGNRQRLVLYRMTRHDPEVVGPLLRGQRR
jgi:hypothetical protein